MQARAQRIQMVSEGKPNLNHKFHFAGKESNKFHFALVKIVLYHEPWHHTLY